MLTLLSGLIRVKSAPKCLLLKMPEAFCLNVTFDFLLINFSNFRDGMY